MTASERQLVTELNAEIKRLRKALDPFAKMANGKENWPEASVCGVFPTMAMVRAARRALR